MTPEPEMAVYAEYGERVSMAVIGMSLCALSGFFVGVFVGWLI